MAVCWWDGIVLLMLLSFGSYRFSLSISLFASLSHIYATMIVKHTWKFILKHLVNGTEICVSVCVCVPLDTLLHNTCVKVKEKDKIAC